MDRLSGFWIRVELDNLERIQNRHDLVVAQLPRFAPIHVYPRLEPNARFPALGVDYTFSRAWHQFQDFPRSAWDARQEAPVQQYYYQLVFRGDRRNCFIFTLLGSAKISAEITISQITMARRSSTRTTEKRSSTSQPSKDTDSLSIITVRRNPRTLGTSRFRLADERNTKPEKGRSKKYDPRRRWKSEEWLLLRPQGFDARGWKSWMTVALVTVLTGAWSTMLFCCAWNFLRPLRREEKWQFLVRYWGMRCIELRGIKINFIILHSIPHPKALWIINRFVKVGLSETNSFIKRIVYYAVCISQNDGRILRD